MTRQYKDTQTRRREVADAALRTIVEDGVGGFTTRAVAERVGIRDGTLFRHFGSKQEIMLEAMSVLEVQLIASLVDTGSALENLKAFFHHRAVFVGEKDAVGALVFSSELVHLVGDQGNKKIRAWKKKTLSYLHKQLDLLQQSGEVRDDLEVAELSMLIQGILLTFAMERTLKTSGTRKQLQARIDKAWAVLCSVILNERASY